MTDARAQRCRPGPNTTITGLTLTRVELADRRRAGTVKEELMSWVSL
jgi:hypothetical protein